MLLSLILAQVLTATQPTGQLQPISATSCPGGQFVNAISNTGSGTCAAASGSGDLLAANNLSELTATAATARANISAQVSGSYSGVGACGASNWVSTLNSSGAPTCTQPGFTNITGTLAVNQGGTGAAPGAGDQLLVSDSTSAATWKALNDCTGAGKALTYVASSNTFGCNTISGSGPTYVVLSANRTNATTSYADITDLIIPVGVNERLDIECRMNYAANATTTGIGIGWVGPASPTLTFGQMTAPLTSATIGGTNIVGNDTGGVTTSSVLATAGNTAIFKGSWLNGANSGNVQMRFKSEVAIANGIIIQAGSWCKYQAF